MFLICGFASSIEKDTSKDIIPAKAWNDAALAAYKGNPVILWQHDRQQIIGKCDRYFKSQFGLFIEASIVDSPMTQQHIIPLLEAGIIRAFSVGIATDLSATTYDKTQDAFILNKIELLEVSLVSIPANRKSLFIADSEQLRSKRTMLDVERFYKQF